MMWECSGSGSYVKSSGASDFCSQLISLLAGDTVTDKSGELRQAKFYVLTSASYGEQSGWITDGSGLYGGRFTRAVIRAIGCAFPAGNWNGNNMPADSNKDKCITLTELANYVSGQCAGYSSVQRYGTGSRVLFWRP